MDNVSTDDLKESRINLKISPKLRTDFQIAAKLKGATMSALLHQFIVKTVRDAKEHTPEAFAESDVEAVASQIGLLKGVIGRDVLQEFLVEQLHNLKAEGGKYNGQDSEVRKSKEA